jgi:hypothetical protein
VHVLPFEQVWQLVMPVKVEHETHFAAAFKAKLVDVQVKQVLLFEQVWQLVMSANVEQETHLRPESRAN